MVLELKQNLRNKALQNILNSILAPICAEKLSKKKNRSTSKAHSFWPLERIMKNAIICFLATAFTNFQNSFIHRAYNLLKYEFGINS